MDTATYIVPLSKYVSQSYRKILCSILFISKSIVNYHIYSNPRLGFFSPKQHGGKILFLLLRKIQGRWQFSSGFSPGLRAEVGAESLPTPGQVVCVPEKRHAAGGVWGRLQRKKRETWLCLGGRLCCLPSIQCLHIPTSPPSLPSPPSQFPSAPALALAAPINKSYCYSYLAFYLVCYLPWS